MFDNKLALWRERLTAVRAGYGGKALMGQHARDQTLHVEIFAETEDGENDFDFDADFAALADGGFHGSQCARTSSMAQLVRGKKIEESP